MFVMAFLMMLALQRTILRLAPPVRNAGEPESAASAA
jgi:hypothetical protein